jgi:DNA-directed RNA polymerase
MLYTNLVKIPGEKNKKHHILEVSDKRLLNHRKPSLFNLSMKLPMVCEPVKYTAKLLGGYLFNNSKYEENIFIDKKRYRYSSGLTNNIIYDMVNKTSATPFKVNIELLNYLNMYGVQQGLIMEPNTSHEFANKPDLKLFQKKRLISFNSKMTLQEIILDIAEMFSKFPRFYFSVRLDVRGRIYCMPNYFNYQSNELAKALILFADPSVIKKIYTSCIDYLISYGVNSFGGKISKQYLNKKLG